MKVEVEVWQLLTLAGTIVGAFWGVAKMLIAAMQRSIDEKFQAVQSGLKSQDDTNRRLERDLMELKAELPRDYVRREDYTQAIATIMTKIDHVAMRMERAIADAYTQARSQSNGGQR